MKILFLTSFSVKDKNAGGTRLRKVIPLLDNKIDIHLVSLPDLEKSKHIRCRFDNIIFGIKWVFGRNILSFERFSNKSIIGELKTITDHIKPDFVHFDGFLSLAVEDSFPNMKKLFHVHDAYSLKYPGWIKSEKRLLRRLKLIIDYRRAVRIENKKFSSGIPVIVDSLFDSNYYISKGYNSFCIPLGFDQNEYFHKPTVRHLKCPNVMLSGNMSSLQTIEGIRFFFGEIYPIIVKEVPDVTIYLVGANPVAEIEKIISDYSGVFITGYVENLNDYLNQCDVYVFPGRVGSGMKTRTLEALAAGCPVVSTSQGAIGLEECWTYIDIANNARDIAQFIINRLTKRESVSRKGQSVFLRDKFSWEVMAGSLMSIYENE